MMSGFRFTVQLFAGRLMLLRWEDRADKGPPHRYTDRTATGSGLPTTRVGEMM